MLRIYGEKEVCGDRGYLFPLQNRDAEVLAEVMDEREKREVREVYQLVEKEAVPNDSLNRLNVAECQQVRELARYWLGCWYFKEGGKR